MVVRGRRAWRRGYAFGRCVGVGCNMRQTQAGIRSVECSPRPQRTGLFVAPTNHGKGKSDRCLTSRPTACMSVSHAEGRLAAPTAKASCVCERISAHTEVILDDKQAVIDSLSPYPMRCVRNDQCAAALHLTQLPIMSCITLSAGVCLCFLIPPEKLITVL